MASAGQWWNIWTLASAQAELLVPHTIEQATAPQQGGTSKWGQIYTVNGPYPTKAAAEAAMNKNHGPASGSTGTGGAPGNPLGTIGDFFSRLTQANTWIRVGEVLLGLVLLAVGVARLTHAVPIATKVAQTVGAVGLMA